MTATASMDLLDSRWTGMEIPQRHRPVTQRRLNFAMLTYNALAHTKRCIASIRACTDEPFNLFVVDNDSRDDSRAWLSAQDSEGLHVRFAPRNLGVPGGRNALLATILPHVHHDGFLIFVDNDLEFLPGWREPFERVFAAHPCAGIASKQGSHILVHRDRRQLLPTPVTTAPVDVASGGFACWIRARTARAVGSFDENLGLFWQEDDDYCIRAAALGHEVFAVPEAAVLHHEHASGVALDDLREGGCARNAAYLAHKWRKLGLVDADGWIVHENHLSYLPVADRRALQRKLGRETPFLRCEFARARLDLARALAAQDLVAEVATWMRPAAPLHHALLELQRERAGAAGDLDVANRIDAVREVLTTRAAPALWRPLLDTPPERPAGAPPARLSKMCSIADFADPTWRMTAELVAHEPSGPSYHISTHENWASVQILHGLFELGLVRPGARGLAVCTSADPIAAPLRARVFELASRTFIPSNPPRAPQGLTREHFDFAYVVGGPAYGPGALVALLGAILLALRPGGVIGITDVMPVSPGANTAGVSPAALHAFLVSRFGLEPIEAPDFTISDATFASASVRGTDQLDLPSCMHANNGTIYASGVFFYRWK